MRLKALVLSLAAYLLMTVAAHAAVSVPTPLVSIDASNLPLGDLLVWYNQGTLLTPNSNNAGQFTALGAPPQVEMVAGRKAVTFNGLNGFRSNFTCPQSMTGTQPWSVSAWVYNNNPGRTSEQWFITWTRNGANQQVAACGYGYNLGYGAIHHYGGNNDLGWDRGVPANGVWHQITYVYSGISNWESVYVDGIRIATENKALNMDVQDINFPFLLGVTDDPNSYNINFTGSLASLKVWAFELSTDQILAQYYGDPAHPENPATPPYCPAVINGGFERPNGWSQNTAPANNRVIPGWGYNDTSDVANIQRNEIGVCGPNLNLNPGGSPWDNGANPEGVKVLCLTGMANAPTGVSQYFYLVSGRTYRLHFAYNCKTTGNPTMTVRAAGKTIGNTPFTVSPCDATGAFDVPFFEFDSDFTVDSTGFWPIEIEESDAGSNNVLLIDDVRLMAYGNNQNPVKIDQESGLDFGLVAKSSTTYTSLTIHNLTNTTMNFGNNYGPASNGTGWNMSGADSGSFDFGYIDSNGTFQRYANNSNAFSVGGFNDVVTNGVVRFKPSTTAMKTYKATLNLTYSNGNAAGIRAIPLQGTIAPYPQILNGSFETPMVNNWGDFRNSASTNPYDYGGYLGDGLAIPNWLYQAQDTFWYSMPMAGIGLEDRQYSNRFLNNGDIPDGRQGLFMQTIADQPDKTPDNKDNGSVYPAYSPRTRTIRQYLGGFIAGHTYKVSLWAGSRNSGSSKAAISVALDNIQLTATVASTPSSGSATPNTGAFDIKQPALRHSSVTLTNCGFVKLEYQYTATKEGPLPLDISSYAFRVANGSSWLNDSTLMLDQVEIFDTANNVPALDPKIRGYESIPATNPNRYMASLSYFQNPYQNPMLSYSGVGLQVATQYYRFFNRGGGTLNVTKWAFEGVNGKHWVPPGTGTVKPYGNYADFGVAFKPKDPGYQAEKLVVTTNDTTGTYKFPIQGYAFGGPAIQNGSFEQPPVYWAADVTAGTTPQTAPNAWIWRCNGTAFTVPFWGFTANANSNENGVSPQMDADLIGNGATFRMNNGMITQGLQCLWMRSSYPASGVGNRSAQQKLYGFQANQKYHFRVWVNAGVMNDNNANFILRVNGTDVIQASDTTNPPTTQLTPVDNINEFAHPFKLMEGDFTAPGTNAYNIDLYVPFNDYDSTVMIDAVDCQAVINGVKKWSLFE